MCGATKVRIMLCQQKLLLRIRPPLRRGRTSSTATRSPFPSRGRLLFVRVMSAKISIRTKERSLGQAFSKACGVSGRRPDLRPQNAGRVNLHAAKRHAKKKVREDFLSPLGDMSARADIFGSIPHVMSAKIRQGRPRPPCGQKPGNQERKKQKACPRHLLSTATAF